MKTPEATRDPDRLIPVTARNPGMPLELDWVRDIRINRSAVERRAATLGPRRSVKREWQAAWLLRAITCIDLTTLQGDDTPGRVRRLCAKARQPVRLDLLQALGAERLPVRAAAVCVYHAFVETAVEALRGSGIPVAAVSTGFPAGLSPMAERVAEIRASVAAGAEEIDVVITRSHVLTGNWPALYDEVRAFREACGDAHIKTILANAAQRGPRQPGLHDGGRRLHQDLDRQGAGQCHPAGRARHGADHSRVP
jgi:deoxyribose-phosphate aldolase